MLDQCARVCSHNAIVFEPGSSVDVVAQAYYSCITIISEVFEDCPPQAAVAVYGDQQVNSEKEQACGFEEHIHKMTDHAFFLCGVIFTFIIVTSAAIIIGRAMLCEEGVLVTSDSRDIVGQVDMSVFNKGVGKIVLPWWLWRVVVLKRIRLTHVLGHHQ